MEEIEVYEERRTDLLPDDVKVVITNSKYLDIGGLK